MAKVHLSYDHSDDLNVQKSLHELNPNLVSIHGALSNWCNSEYFYYSELVKMRQRRQILFV